MFGDRVWLDLGPGAQYKLALYLLPECMAEQ